MSPQSIGRLVLICLKYAPVHANLMLAYRSAYLRRRPGAKCLWIAPPAFAESVPEGDDWVKLGVDPRYPGGMIRLLWFALNVKADTFFDFAPERHARVHIFVQSTHPANAVIIWQCRRLLGNVSVHYYLHEPGTVALKLRRGDGVASAFAVTLAHHVDLAFTDRFYVAHAAARQRAVSSYFVPGLATRCDILPLPFVDLCADWRAPIGGKGQRSPHLLLLGRADNRRCLDLFIECAQAACVEHPDWRFTVLSSSPDTLPAQARRLPNLALHMGTRYADKQMSHALLNATHVFNLFRISYTQSGVTPVALMHGVPVIASAWERDAQLESFGCIYFDGIPTAQVLIETIERAPVPANGELRRQYLNRFDADSIELPDSAIL